MNKVNLIGRMTDDIKVNYASASQMAVGRFCLAIDDGYGEKKRTNFINCIAFGKTAESMEQHTCKGCRVAVDGKIQTGSYQKNDGTKVYTTDVIADRVEYIDFKDRGQKPADSGTQIEDFQAIDEFVPF